MAGTDRILGRRVAVKLLAGQFAAGELVRRFQREARIAAGLQHPGITVVHDVGSHAGQPFIVMELLQGRDLASVLAESPGGLPVGTAVPLAVQAAEALGPPTPVASSTGTSSPRICSCRATGC